MRRTKSLQRSHSQPSVISCCRISSKASSIQLDPVTSDRRAKIEHNQQTKVIKQPLSTHTRTSPEQFRTILVSVINIAILVKPMRIYLASPAHNPEKASWPPKCREWTIQRKFKRNINKTKMLEANKWPSYQDRLIKQMRTQLLHPKVDDVHLCTSKDRVNLSVITKSGSPGPIQHIQKCPASVLQVADENYKSHLSTTTGTSRNVTKVT